MSLVERIQTPRQRSYGLECSVGVILDTLKGDELDAFKVMLGTPEKRGWSQQEIYEALTSEGYEVGRQTINRHRAKGCRCFK